jgi:pimeloyl-ACP methyl ester carboxylesterase
MVVSESEQAGPQFADANGIRLCYETFGRRGDPPIVLIMGLAGQMILWDEDFCTALAAQGRYVVRFDNRDIGQSTHFDASPAPSMRGLLFARLLGRTPQAPYALVDMARDTIGLMDALGIERFDVVGASMGGAIVQELLINFPQRLRTATAIMASTGAPRLPPPTVAALRVLTRRPTTERAAYVDGYVKAWRVLAGEHFPFDAMRMRRQAERGFERGLNPPGVSRQMLAIVASGNRKPALANVRVPTLVLHGSIDPLVPLAHGRDLAASIPGAKLRVIEGMGHTLPRQAWPQILDEIGKHASPASPPA